MKSTLLRTFDIKDFPELYRCHLRQICVHEDFISYEYERGYGSRIDAWNVYIYKEDEPEKYERIVNQLFKVFECWHNCLDIKEVSIVAYSKEEAINLFKDHWDFEPEMVKGPFTFKEYGI